MTDDLVTRLREEAEEWLQDGVEYGLHPLLTGAANEIERLRALLTIDDAMVERAITAFWASRGLGWEAAIRAELEAALGKENGNG